MLSGKVRALTPAAVAALVLVLEWQTLDLSEPSRHLGRVWFSWSAACVLGAVAVNADAVRLLRSGRRLTLPIAAADVLLSLCAAATVLGAVGGSWGTIFAVVIGIPSTAAALFVRARTGGGHLDGSLAVAFILALLSWGAHTRPWTPRSGQWAVVSAVAVAASVTVCWAATRDVIARRRGRTLVGVEPSA